MRLRNEELHYLWSSPNIIGVIRSGRMGWAGLVTRVREKRNMHIRDHFEDQDVDGIIILNYVFKTMMGGLG